MKRSGFSLIEVVVGAAILAIFVIPLFHTLVSTHKGTVLLQEDVQAVLLGLELVDQIKLIPLKYLDGIGEVPVNDGDQPVLDKFRGSPLYAVIATQPDSVKNLEAQLQLLLSPLPEGYSRSLKVEEKSGFCARFSVTVNFESKDMKGNVKNRSRTISGIVMEEH